MKLREIVALNRHAKDIIEARELQNEASFYVSFDKTNPHIDTFRSRVLEIYAGDKHKYKRFFNAFAGQIMPSIEICETIYSQVYRVWDSQNRVREYNFKNVDLHDEALSYVGNMMLFWLSDFWEAYKQQFCSFIIVDVPTQQIDLRPSPYPFILDVNRVIYIEFDSKHKVKQIIFKSFEQNASNEKEREYWYYYTDKFYSKYLIDGENEIEQFVKPHNLGRCPVHKVWNERLNQSSEILTKSLITPNFEDLFKFNIKTIESFKADLLYLNPTLQQPKISCGYNSTKDKENRYPNTFGEVECANGYLVTIDGRQPVVEDGTSVLCPNCGRQRNASGGAGSSISIDLDAQAIKDGKINPTQALFQFITPDIDGVKEQYSRVKDLGERIIKSSVGSDDQPTESAINELQQQAIFESKESVLKRISAGISKIITDVERDILELRYADQFISNKYNQGTEFYLHTVEELLDVRKKSKDPIQKRQVDEQIIEVKYRNNQKKLNEEKLLYKLLPYNTLTDEEFLLMAEKGAIKDEQAIGLRFQFSNAIELFESEFGSIIEFFTYKFSENIPEKRRLEVVKSLLITNIKIEKNVVQDQVPGTS